MTPLRGYVSALALSAPFLAGCFTGTFGDSGSGGDSLATSGGPGSGSGGAFGSGGSGEAGGAGGLGGSGGEVGCASPDECPGIDTPCSFRVCSGNSCGIDHAPAGTSCSEGGTKCDGGGSCVECLESADCGDGICQQRQCVPASCSDGQLNGDESDVDCGGSCGPCGDGLVCQGAEDCVSAYCDGGVCAPCTSHGQCAAGQYCQGGSCQPDKPLGDVCTAAAQCQSGFCPSQDGVCCQAACNGSCVACTAGKTGASNGTCAPIAASTDPDAECPAQSAASCLAAGTGCNGNSQSPGCNLHPSGTTCAAPSCNGGQASAASTCDGMGTCDVGTTSSCAPYVCGTNACRSSCNGNSHCVSGYVCDSGICVQDSGCQGAGPTTTPLDAEEQSLLALVNQHRANNSKSPLSACTSLNRAAQGHSEDMRDNDYFSHTGLNDSSFSQRACWACYQGACGPTTGMAENIAAGNSGAQATFNQWLNSPGHNANMLGSYSRIGIGRATGGGTYGSYWTNVFAGANEASCN